ncbi:hypothetical protein BDK51DRAFT_20067 [Blyttiomyces helicus]|uniref:GATA-type domain-containing protein n=1 Tax=Blyttiomyces helicus TaxID=388810 RepID=A0A4P9VZ32_9FUNG|nr:hypothetical protein BDK51DRAFT_20067 [Blyttiomyces helicus]|eukprot:RKO84562.1 hypothetical protein BDK51DRAFT_20067 [Blyttiomyces helicus]
MSYDAFGPSDNYTTLSSAPHSDLGRALEPARRVSKSHNPSRASGSTTSTKSNPGNLSCFNCETTTTPLWRKFEDDKLLCNACGL